MLVAKLNININVITKVNSKLLNYVLLVMLGNYTICAQNDIASSTEINKELPLFFPISQDDFIRVSSTFGYRKHPVFHNIKKHKGIDLVAEKGKPVYATASGKVIKSDYDINYGKRIVIKHANEIKTLYAHLMYQFVKPGNKVKQGQLIGLVGESGLATGPHLHFEIWIKRKRVNPLAFWNLMIKSYKSQLVLKQKNNHG